jgi:hypothetical protein
MTKNMATKKTAVKKSVTEASFEKRFWLCDGQVFSTLKELAAGLDKMDDAIWQYHVTLKKNDFANWIEGVFGEKKLGQAVRQSKNAKALLAERG